jgi:hypothetical protein
MVHDGRSRAQETCPDGGPVLIDAERGQHYLNYAYGS